MITVFLHLFQGLDVVETKLPITPSPPPSPPWQTLGLSTYPGWVWRRKERCSGHKPLPLLPASHSSGEAGPPDGPGWCCECSPDPLPQPPALPPSLRLLVALLPAQTVRKEEQGVRRTWISGGLCEWLRCLLLSSWAQPLLFHLQTEEM